jgi:hypothetical protein
MAGKYNKWLRAKLAARIESNGGYWTRHEPFALEWMVYYSGEIADAEDAKKGLVEHEHFLSEADLLLQFPDFDEWYEENVGDGRQMWEHAQELLQDDLSNNEGLRMWSPKTAAKYGFEYKGEGADKPFDMTLGRYGGGGKHVCLTEFEGVTLSRSCRDLAEWVSSHLDPDTYSPSLSNEWCRKLMGIMDELDETLTDENAERCGYYYETDWLARELGLFD